ncbi:hypothetical protein E4U46_004119 [Claviceps purpurea]|nr:hypothetical protein E4U46_004119 [Claviceps purpurea]
MTGQNMDTTTVKSVLLIYLKTRSYAPSVLDTAPCRAATKTRYSTLTAETEIIPDDLDIGSDFTPFVSSLWLQKDATEAFSWYPVQRRYWYLRRLTGTSKSQQKWKHPTLVMEYIKKTQVTDYSSISDSIREAIRDNF